jgi:hypothetical protein
MTTPKLYMQTLVGVGGFEGGRPPSVIMEIKL